MLKIKNAEWVSNRYARNTIQITADKWRIFLKMILQSYLRKINVTGNGIIVNYSPYCIKIDGLGYSLDIPTTNFKEWVKQFIDIMERYENVEISDSILRGKGSK